MIFACHLLQWCIQAYGVSSYKHYYNVCDSLKRLTLNQKPKGKTLL